VIEKYHPGGVCLNEGCIPSKTLLASAHLIKETAEAGQRGVDVSEGKPNWEKIQQRRAQIIENFRKGMALTLKNNKVTYIAGTAVVKSPSLVEVTTPDGKIEVQTDKLIIATGSTTVEIPDFPFDGEIIIGNKEVLELESIPESMVIIGGGYIGAEIACAYAAFGSKITILETLPKILPHEDQWVSKLLQRELKKQNIDVFIECKVLSVEKKNGQAIVKTKCGKTINAEKVLVAVGRKPLCDAEILGSLGLEMNGNAIKVNKKFETSVPNVYAVGDVIGTTFLAHGATAEAEVLVDNLFGKDVEMYSYSLIPRVVFTFPEVASIGLSEERSKEKGLEVVVGKAFFRADGRSVAHNELVGEVRVIRDINANRIAGITMVGARVTEFAALARTLIGTQEEFRDICFPHPTVSEVLADAIEDAFGK